MSSRSRRKMERFWRFGYGLILSFTLTACNRGGRVPSSVSSISIPASKLAKIMAALPTGRTPCFGVNITGNEITSNISKCGPASGLGIVGGFVPVNTDITVPGVPPNESVNVDVYVYLLPANQSTAACPTMGFAPTLLSNMYLVGSVANVAINSNPNQEVDITYNYQSNSPSLAQQLPATCSPSSGISPFQISINKENLTGTGVNFNAKMSASSKQIMSGTGVNFTVR